MKNESINVFLDTNVFIRHGFNTESGQLKRLEDLSVSGDVRIFMTEINYEEVKLNIKEKSKETVDEFEKFIKKTKLLNRIAKNNIEELVKIVDANVLEEKIITEFKRFLRTCRVTFLSNKAIDVRKVFKKYFTRTLPFRDSKKNEFPDAFMLASIESWCNYYDKKMYIVSSDGDIINSCSTIDGIVCLKNLDEFFDKVTSTENYRHNVALQTIKDNIKIVEDAAENALEETEFYIDDANGNVLDKEVELCAVKDIYIVEIGENYAVAKISMMFTVNFEVEYSEEYTDDTLSEFGISPARATYENIDNVESKIPADIKVRFAFGGGQAKSLEVVEFDFTCRQFIRVLN